MQLLGLRSGIGGCIILMLAMALPGQAQAKITHQSSPTPSLQRPKTNPSLPDYLETLRTAAQPGGGPGGAAAVPSQEYKAFEVAIQAGETIRPELEQMLRTGTPVGKVYAAALLMQFDPNAARQIFENMQSDRTPIVMMPSGVLIIEESSIGQWSTEILQGTNDAVFFPQALPLPLATLRNADRLEGKAIGVAAQPSLIYQSYEASLRIGKMWQWQLETVLRQSTPAGRIYITMLWVKLDEKAGRQALEQLRSDQNPLTEASGCEISQTTVGDAVNDILQGRSGIFPKLQ
jgi:hypothetical protein